MDKGSMTIYKFLQLTIQNNQACGGANDKPDKPSEGYHLRKTLNMRWSEYIREDYISSEAIGG